MLFIWYPKCSTCQKAKKWLDDNNIEYTLRDIVLETPTEEELSIWIKESGLDIKKFFNTSGMKYRELGLKDKLDNMSFEDKIKLLSSDGMLIKRPLIVGDKIIPGFKNYDSLK
ncbi:transcriptional regulator Spx/MgsR family [Firmicutes bacterium CAG:822]|nr:transcriptional regulator Spx/MgsR family [Firmicutes bacterium CAG:822]